MYMYIDMNMLWLRILCRPSVGGVMPVSWVMNSPSFAPIGILTGAYNRRGGRNNVRDVPFTSEAMFVCWVGFCVEVGQVVHACSPKNHELANFYSVLDPMKTHCSRLQTTNSNGFVCCIGRCSVVTPNFCCKLGKSKIGQNILKNARSLSHHK